ncbi:MAG TPA: hypothetical protein VF746_21455 [Longimicrobium sp.]
MPGSRALADPDQALERASARRLQPGGPVGPSTSDGDRVMDNRGASPLRILLIAAAVLIAIVFVAFGQLYIALAIFVFALIFGAAALFARARTPTD